MPHPRSRAALAALVAALSAPLLAGCGASSSGDGGRLKVVASTPVVADLARNVGGPDVAVTQLLRPNTDPHDYEPRPKDVVDTAGADVVLTSGKHLDAWMDDVAKQSGSDALPVNLADNAAVTGDDPHWWQDPRNAARAAIVIAGALASADPARAATYRDRGAAYAGRIRATDRRIASCIAKIPQAERKMVTDHDAFGRFAARYGIDVVGAVIPAQTTQAQPSAGDVAGLVATIRREHVRAIFPETSVNRRLADTIARQTGATADHELYGDTLGPKGSSGATYLTMLTSNADAISAGLTGHRCP